MGRNLHQLAYANTLGEQKKVGRVGGGAVETIGVGAREVHAFGVNVAVCGAGTGGVEGWVGCWAPPASSLMPTCWPQPLPPPPHTHTLEPELAPMIPPLAPGALLPPQAWESAWFIRLLRCSPGWLLNVIADSLALLLFNPVTLW